MSVESSESEPQILTGSAHGSRCIRHITPTELGHNGTCSFRISFVARKSSTGLRCTDMSSPSYECYTSTQAGIQVIARAAPGLGEKRTRRAGTALSTGINLAPKRDLADVCA
jgi:hypothetical protein